MGGWVGGVGGVGWVGGYDQLCCPASPKLLLGLDLGLGCDKNTSYEALQPLHSSSDVLPYNIS